MAKIAFSPFIFDRLVRVESFPGPRGAKFLAGGFESGKRVFARCGGERFSRPCPGDFGFSGVATFFGRADDVSAFGLRNGREGRFFMIFGGRFFGLPLG